MDTLHEDPNMIFESILLSPIPLMIVYWDSHESEARAIPVINFTYEISEHASNITLYIHSVSCLYTVYYEAAWIRTWNNCCQHPWNYTMCTEKHCHTRHLQIHVLYHYFHRRVTCPFEIYKIQLHLSKMKSELKINWKLFNTETRKKDVNLRATVLNFLCDFDH